jgi:hypothetical protein
MNFMAGTPQDQDMLFQSCETRRLQDLRHLMFRQHTCKQMGTARRVECLLGGCYSSMWVPTDTQNLHWSRTVARAPSRSTLQSDLREIAG